MSVKIKNSLKRPIIIYGTGISFIILAVLFFSIRGYPLVTTATTTLNIYAPPLYMISIFFPYGILIGEAIWLWNEEKEHFIYIVLFFESFIIGIFSFVRYIISIPFSGHAIILFFYLFHQAINNRFKHLLRFLIGILVLIITIIYKIFMWYDPITFLLGALLGISLWLPGFIYRKKIIKLRLTHTGL